jgi:hypothetical protein
LNVWYFPSFKTPFDAQEIRANHEDELLN